MPHSITKQPPAFRMIFLLELWERFGFYTVQGILAVYFIRYLGYSEIDSYYTFGAFSALVYGLVVVGGYLGDQILGTKRTIVVGLIVLVSGYLCLAVIDKVHVFWALGLICTGNGLFKANPSNLLAKCYETNDQRLHQGFTLYYMAINIGSMIALFLGPSIAAHYGYSYAFIMSSIGLLLGLANFCYQFRYIRSIQTPADLKVISWFTWGALILGILLCSCGASYLLQHYDMANKLLAVIIMCTLLYYMRQLYQQNRLEKIRMVIALILIFEAIIFFTLYQQMPTSINLFAVNNITPQLFGITLDPQSFQALNPIWIISLSPLLAIFYAKLNTHQVYFSIAHKFALGMTCAALSFLVLFLSRYFPTTNGLVSPWWLVGSYLFQALGELLISALGVAMVAELVPQRIAGFVMGMWFLSSAAAGFTGAWVASYTALPKLVKPGMHSLLVYTEVFKYIGIGVGLIALIMWLSTPYLNYYINLKNTTSTK